MLVTVLRESEYLTDPFYTIVFLKVIKMYSSLWTGQMGLPTWKGQGCRDPCHGSHVRQGNDKNNNAGVVEEKWKNLIKRGLQSEQKKEFCKELNAGKVRMSVPNRISSMSSKRADI